MSATEYGNCVFIKWKATLQGKMDQPRWVGVGRTQTMGFGGFCFHFVFALIKHNVKGKKSRNTENNLRKWLYPFIKSVYEWLIGWHHLFICI